MKISRLLFLLILVLLLPSMQLVTAQGNSPLVLVMSIDDPIMPSIQHYLERGIATAEQRNAEVLIVKLNTPGGDGESMLNMMASISNSPVPVVVFVYPRGGYAFSAGAMITMAGHAAAMAPETAIGASSPIDASGQDLGETAKAKAIEGIVAKLIPLVERRGPKAVELAKSMVTDAKAVPVNEALEVGLIDFVAEDVDDLLVQLDGFEVQLASGKRVLNTSNARVDDLGMSFIEELLSILTDPNISFLLIAIGMQAIFIELGSPGGWVAGFIGVVCLALAAYGLGVLPVNWFGFVFLITSFVLFILDVKAPTHGALTAAGIATFIMGALVLFNSPGTPQFQRVSIPLVVSVGIATGVLFAILVGFAVRAMRVPIRAGRESLVGATGVAKSALKPTGQVQVESELWTAETVEGSEKIRKGDRVEVVEVQGLRLRVRKV